MGDVKYNRIEFHGIRDKKEKVHEDIVLAMRRRVEWFKYFITCDDKHYKHPEREFIKDEHYGCKGDKYYCIFTKTVHFIYKDRHLCSNRIIFNDELKCWFVRDIDKKEIVAFEALDTDSKLAFFDMLDHFVDMDNWSYAY